MPYERVPRSDAGRWTTLLGFALAVIAAGSFIAFSLVARDATSEGPGAPVVAIAPVASAPALTFVQPGEFADRAGRTSGDGVRVSSDGRDLVLGTRFFDGPIAGGPATTAPSRGTSDGECRTRCNGGTKDKGRTMTPTTIPTRELSGTNDKGKSKGKPAGKSKGKPAGAGPSSNGHATGHEKARGKGHDKHPGDN